LLVPTAAGLAPEGETSTPVAFTFDSEPVRLRAEATDRGVRLFELDAGVVFDVVCDAREVTVRYAGSRLSARVRFMRVIREYFHNHALHSGRLLLHAAAVVHKGRALAIAGRKGAGKTTAMLRLLERDDTAFLSNDRVLVDVSQAPLARGVPTVVAHRTSRWLCSWPVTFVKTHKSGWHVVQALLWWSPEWSGSARVSSVT
jgi:hypothetical protein